MGHRDTSQGPPLRSHLAFYFLPVMHVAYPLPWFNQITKKKSYLVPEPEIELSKTGIHSTDQLWARDGIDVLCHPISDISKRVFEAVSKSFFSY